MANRLSIGAEDGGDFPAQSELHRLAYPLFEGDCMENLLCADCYVEYSQPAFDWRRRMMVLFWLNL